MIYAVVTMDPRLDMRREICDALAAGDWYTSSISAFADMDQYNQFEIDRISQEAYDEGDFTLLGVVKLGNEGLVTSYED